MIENNTRLRSVRQTGREMHRIIREYCRDMALNASMPLREFYDNVKMMPYAPDPKNREYIRRPLASMLGLGPGLDCDDKCIIMMAYARLNNIPAKMISTGRGKVVRHVFPLFLIQGKWRPVDATYPRNTLFCWMYKPKVVKELFA
jgi:transglutaminase-like putative cysteine protease